MLDETLIQNQESENQRILAITLYDEYQKLIKDNKRIYLKYVLQPNLEKSNEYAKLNNPSAIPLPPNKLLCEICHIRYTPSNKHNHNKTKYHKTILKINNKYQEFLLQA